MVAPNITGPLEGHNYGDKMAKNNNETVPSLDALLEAPSAFSREFRRADYTSDSWEAQKGAFLKLSESAMVVYQNHRVVALTEAAASYVAAKLCPEVSGQSLSAMSIVKLAASEAVGVPADLPAGFMWDKTTKTEDARLALVILGLLSENEREAFLGRLPRRGKRNS